VAVNVVEWDALCLLSCILPLQTARFIRSSTKHMASLLQRLRSHSITYLPTHRPAAELKRPEMHSLPSIFMLIYCANFPPLARKEATLATGPIASFGKLGREPKGGVLKTSPVEAIKGQLSAQHEQRPSGPCGRGGALAQGRYRSIMFAMLGDAEMCLFLEHNAPWRLDRNPAGRHIDRIRDGVQTIKNN